MMESTHDIDHKARKAATGSASPVLATLFDHSTTIATTPYKARESPPTTIEATVEAPIPHRAGIPGGHRQSLQSLAEEAQ
jgi:hypothetical protein